MEVLVAGIAKASFGCTEVVDGEALRGESFVTDSASSYSSVKSLGEREAMVPLVAVAPSEDGEVVGVLLFITVMRCRVVPSGVVNLDYEIMS